MTEFSSTMKRNSEYLAIKEPQNVSKLFLKIKISEL